MLQYYSEEREYGHERNYTVGYLGYHKHLYVRSGQKVEGGA